MSTAASPAGPTHVSPARSGRKSKLLPYIVCPHCWHRFDSSDIVWVARHSELIGDTRLGDQHAQRFMPTRFTPHCEALDSRGTPCQQLACPRCHLVIPRVFLSCEAVVLSLIGVPFSGKSYFLASMASELSRILPTKFGLAFTDVDASINQTLIDYQKSLFLQEDKERPVGIIKTQTDSVQHYDTTMLDDQSVRLPRPFLFNIRPINGHPRAAEAENLTRVLCLYDNAGEHFLPQGDSVLAPVTQHMVRARMLMFLFDPVQDPRIREKCRSVSEDPQLNEYAHTELQSTVLSEAVNRVREYAHLPPNRKLDQPLIVMLSKSDVFAKLIDEDITTDPYLSGGKFSVVDIGRIRRVSRKARQMMLTLAPEFVAAADDAFREVIYIPVSALGCSPEPIDKATSTSTSLSAVKQTLVVRPGKIQPRWVTVPIMYAIAMSSPQPTDGTGPATKLVEARYM